MSFSKLQNTLDSRLKLFTMAFALPPPDTCLNGKQTQSILLQIWCFLEDFCVTSVTSDKTNPPLTYDLKLRTQHILLQNWHFFMTSVFMAIATDLKNEQRSFAI